MNNNLKAKLETLPLLPGCYLMKDIDNNIIYVGKAKKLKNRVNQYFKGAHDYKTTKLVSNIVDFDYFVTSSEKEALLLEINLIKKYRPKFNIMFMDDKSYPYIKLSNYKYPRLQVVREAKKDNKSKYFGPFPDATAAHQTLSLLNTIYPTRKCNKIPNKVCLYYHMHQCLGPCEFQIDQSIIDEMINDIQRFLKGDTAKVIEQLNNKMNEAVEHFEYEKAKEYRDLILSVDHITDRQQVQTNSKKDIDVFNYYVDKGYIAIQGLFVRSGKLLEKAFSLTPIYGEEDEEFISFISQYYEIHPLPSELVLPQNIEIEGLKELLSINIVQPQKGYRKQLLNLCLENATNNLEQKFEVIKRKDDELENANQQLKDIFNNQNLETIELFDNSHIQGSFSVAGLVSYKNGLPNKKDYRLYKLHTNGNDLESMKEVIYRRYFRLVKENKKLPDLIIVDGGINQIKAAAEIKEMLNLDVTIAGLVKDSNHRTSNLMNEKLEIIEVEPSSSLFFLLTRMQDEVHRFAISYHKKLRSKAQTKSILDEVEGIGEVRKKKLMNHYKSFKNLKEASIEEISKIIPEKVAILVYNSIHEK